MATLSEVDAGGKNVLAFLDMLAWSEGTPKYGTQDGYDVLVGGGLFYSFADHPRTLVVVNKAGLKSTAAGRYQLLARFFDSYKKLLNLEDFSPASQDRIAIQQIRECKAFGWVQRGNLDYAIPKVAHIWASLPGAGYGQHENKFPPLVAAYVAAGGLVV